MCTVPGTIVAYAVGKCRPAGLCLVTLTAMLTTSLVGAEPSGVAGNGDRAELAAMRQWAERAC